MNSKLVLGLVFFLASIVRAAETDSVFHYTWQCGTQQRECSIFIDSQLLDYYRKDREHLAYRYAGFGRDDIQTTPNFSGFIFSEYGKNVIKDFAEHLVHDTMTEEESVMSALTFVQSLPYATDQETKGQEEYVRFPLETLADGVGDCEDKGVLLGAILSALEVDYILLLLPDHLALGVQCNEIEEVPEILFNERRYLYVETTSPHWSIGRIPDEYSSSDFEVCLVQDLPELIIKGVGFETTPASVLEKADCTLKLTLFNAGPQDVSGLRLEVRFIRNRPLGEAAVTEVSFALEDLPEGKERVDELNFKSLISQSAVLQVRLSGNKIPDQTLELNMQ